MDARGDVVGMELTNDLVLVSHFHPSPGDSHISQSHSCRQIPSLSAARCAKESAGLDATSSRQADNASRQHLSLA